MATLTNSPKLVYYGDDFTGSTDALDFLSRSGIPAVLFLSPPSPAELEQFPELEAIGVAGKTRSLTTPELRNTLADAFPKLAQLQPDFIHYKVCSTFDSSPEIGSIGAAIECGRSTFPHSAVPVLVGHPAIGRYCVFGNLFAHLGTQGDGTVYRIDQHPSMAHHPVTPAKDGNLLDHLARQTSLKSGLFDILSLEQPQPDQQRKLQDQLAQESTDAVFFDILKEEHLTSIGRIFRQMRPENSPLFIVGSSAVEAALCKEWRSDKQQALPTPEAPALGNGPILILSGSCSPVTAQQIRYANHEGFKDVALLPESAQHKDHNREIGLAAANQLAKGHSVIVHSCLGPHDERLRQLKNGDRQLIGLAMGAVLEACVAAYRPAAIGVAGGDTSSEIAHTLGIQAVSFAEPFFPGAPLCQAIQKSGTYDGMFFNFKGGQVGPPDYFVQMRKRFR
jgi:uncharacterized protein YgbK (DUF1537 family)